MPTQNPVLHVCMTDALARPGMTVQHVCIGLFFTGMFCAFLSIGAAVGTVLAWAMAMAPLQGAAVGTLLAAVILLRGRN